MLLQMVAVDQFIQIIGSFGVILINVRHLRVRLSVDQIIEKIGNGYAESNGQHYGPDTHIGFNGLCDQIKAYYTEHHTAGKAQKQTDGPLGVPLEQCAYQAAQACAAYARKSRCDNQGFYNTHTSLSYIRFFIMVTQEKIFYNEIFHILTYLYSRE